LDSPWKEALDVYFRAFLLLLFRDIHDAIDWSRPVEMLDKEFQQLVPRAAQGRRTVDKLVKVWRKNGRAVWLLIHIIEDALRAKFGDEGATLIPALEEINDGEKYIVINRAIALATTLDEVRRACAAAAAPAPRRKKGGNGQRGQRRT
jgi:hypothetical protein